MFKYRLTNTSRERGAAHARPIFLTEAGRLLQPGDAAPINRLDKGTQELIDIGDLKMETGDYPPYVAPKKPKPKRVDDDDFDRPKKAAPSDEKVGFRDVQTGKNRKNDKVVPLPTAGAEPEKAEEGDAMSASTDDDDDLGIPAVTKNDVVSKTGLKDLDDPSSSSSAAVGGFHDNLHVGKPPKN
jgi:hypothetical protein